MNKSNATYPLPCTNLVASSGNTMFEVVRNGKVKFVDREQFTYKLKIDNKIMPDLDLHELVFAPQEDSNKKKTEAPEIKINILEILNGIYKNNNELELLDYVSSVNIFSFE